MALLEIRWRPSVRELRQFGAMLAICLGGLAGYNYASDRTLLACLIGGTVAAGLLAAIRPGWLRPIYVGWMCLVFPIGWMVSHLLLGGVFFLLLTPLGCLLRGFGYDPLRRRPPPEQDSYWEVRDERHDSRRYFRQF